MLDDTQVGVWRLSPHTEAIRRGKARKREKKWTRGAYKIDFLLNWQSFNARKFKPKNGNESKKIIYVGNFGPAQDIHSYIHSLSEVSENYKIEFVKSHKA